MGRSKKKSHKGSPSSHRMRKKDSKGNSNDPSAESIGSDKKLGFFANPNLAQNFGDTISNLEALGRFNDDSEKPEAAANEELHHINPLSAASLSISETQKSQGNSAELPYLDATIWSSPSASRTLGDEDSMTVVKETAEEPSITGEVNPATSRQNDIENHAQKVFDEKTEENYKKSTESDHEEQISHGRNPVTNITNSEKSPTGANFAEVPFNSLFQKNRVIKEGLPIKKRDPTIIDLSQGRKRIVLPKSAEISLEKGWGFCLLGYFSGSFPGKVAVEDLCAQWNSPYTFQKLDSGWLLFTFPDAATRTKVLQGGPYAKLGNQLHLKSIPPPPTLISILLK
ncbi:hypothetical protein ABFS83_07G108300 [Erythranthe nasuta]